VPVTLGTVTIRAGTPMAVAPVEVVGDTLDEAEEPETFLVTLADAKMKAATGDVAVTSNGPGIGYIIDDDGPPAITLPEINLPEITPPGVTPPDVTPPVVKPPAVTPPSPR